MDHQDNGWMRASIAKQYKAACKELCCLSIFSNSERLSPDSQIENADFAESSNALTTQGDYREIVILINIYEFRR